MEGKGKGKDCWKMDGSMKKNKQNWKANYSVYKSNNCSANKNDTKA